MKFAKFSLMVVLVAGIAAFAWASEVTLAPDSPSHGPTGPGLPSPDLTLETLFQGDLIAEIGLGCSNPTGNSGGPNDWAQGVTATLTPPFGITSTTYNIFTNNATAGTQWIFSTWTGVAAPGTVGTTRALNWTDAAVGTHTVAVTPPIVMAAQTFFFGFTQPQSNVGMRVGLDTSSPSAVRSYLRAPTCGAAAFVTIDSLGFPGNWVMSVVIDDTIPVELMQFEIQ